MDRLDVQFRSQDGHCAAWLYRPDSGGPAPLVVMAHGFSGTREQRLDAYAERFQSAGMGVLLFDYRHFGASPGEPRQLLDIKRQLADFHAAVAFGRELEWVDADRVALFGSSFSGGHVIAVGAQDRRIAAIVSQCPFTDGMAVAPKMGVRNLARATFAGLRDQLGALAGRPPRYIAAVGPPGSFAVMSSPGRRARLRRADPARHAVGEPGGGPDRAQRRPLPPGSVRRGAVVPDPVLRL